MVSDMPRLFWLFSIGAALVLITGFYCLIVTYNLIRALIGLELLTKSATLLIILAGYITGRTALAQALAANAARLAREEHSAARMAPTAPMAAAELPMMT
jgi:multisubunit Na+/H+ antiporter MnhC subunit